MSQASKRSPCFAVCSGVQCSQSRPEHLSETEAHLLCSSLSGHVTGTSWCLLSPGLDFRALRRHTCLMCERGCVDVDVCVSVCQLNRHSIVLNIMRFNPKPL